MRFDLMEAFRAEGKAIQDHPVFHGYDPVSVYQPGAPRKEATISQHEAPRHLQAYGGDQAIDWIADCVNLYADATSTAPYRLAKKDGTRLVEAKTRGTPPDYEEGPEDLYELLRQPNPYMRYSELVSLLVIDLLLVGNAYWFKLGEVPETGRPLYIYRLSPAHVTIEPGQFGPDKYVYQPEGAREPLEINPKDVIHFRRPNPHSAFYGLGVIQSGGRSFDLSLAVTETMTSYFENKADPSVIVQSDRRVPRDVFNKLRAQLRARMSGSHRAGELLVLESGLKATTLTPSAREAMLDTAATMDRDRVFTKFRASPKLFGIIDENSGTDSINDIRRDFDANTLLPFMTRLQDLITASLVRAWDVDYFIDYKFQMSPDEIVKVVGEFASVPGVKVREVRRLFAPFGIEESTGDPEIDEMVLNAPGEELGPDGQPVSGGAGFADRPLPGEPGRPPLGKNTRAITNKPAAGSKIQRPQGKASDNAGERFEEVIERLRKIEAEGKAQTTPATPPIPDPLERHRTREVDATRDFIAAELSDAAEALERALVVEVAEGKAFKRSDVVKRLRNAAAWRKFSEAVERILVEGAKRAISASVMHHSDVKPDEDLDYDAIARTVVHRSDGLRGIINTLKARVAKAVGNAREDGAEAEVKRALHEAVESWRADGAKLVGDTEATQAYNEGVLSLAEASGHKNVYVVDGDEHDQPCIDAHGSYWTIDHARENRVEHPRCRRAFLLSPQPV